MPYVQRKEGQIVGRYANCQPGFAEEWLPDDSPELSFVSPAQLSAAERRWRDIELSGVLWLRERHRDQLEIEVDTTLSSEQFTELLVYMQALRDWPQLPDFPDPQKRPTEPAWLSQTKEGDQ